MLRGKSLDEGFISTRHARRDDDDDVEGGAMMVFESKPRTRIS